MDPAVASAEEEQLAEALVDEALADYVGRIPSAALAEIREYLVDELTITTYGRKQLRLLGAKTAADRSAEVLKYGAVEARLKKEGSGA